MTDWYTALDCVCSQSVNGLQSWKCGLWNAKGAGGGCGGWEGEGVIKKDKC